MSAADLIRAAPEVACAPWPRRALSTESWRALAAALAEEAALKCRESAGMWAEAYASGEYRHGPISVAGAGTLVWAMTPLTDMQTRAISDTGARLHQGHDDPQVELVALQRQAVAWASSAGRDADLPIHLSRSVVAV